MDNVINLSAVKNSKENQALEKVKSTIKNSIMAELVGDFENGTNRFSLISILISGYTVYTVVPTTHLELFRNNPDVSIIVDLV